MTAACNLLGVIGSQNGLVAANGSMPVSFIAMEIVAAAWTLWTLFNCCCPPTFVSSRLILLDVGKARVRTEICARGKQDRHAAHVVLIPQVIIFLWA